MFRSLIVGFCFWPSGMYYSKEIENFSLELYNLIYFGWFFFDIVCFVLRGTAWAKVESSGLVCCHAISVAFKIAPLLFHL